MNYKWENLTAPNFKDAVDKCERLCVVPLGVIEKHGLHLPLGTDMFHVNKIAELASEIEPAVIFPPYYLTMIHEAKPQPGTIAIDSSLVADLLENICDEIYRNGFTKILLLNGHGGNETFLQNFVNNMMIESKREYNVYLAGLEHYWYNTLENEKWLDLREEDSGGHGGETETSMIMAINEDLVKKDELKKNKETFCDMKRFDNLKGFVSVPGLDWYARFPNHYAGDGRSGNVEKGKVLLEILSKRIAKIIKVVKKDSNVEKIKQSFFNSIKHKI